MNRTTCVHEIQEAKAASCQAIKFQSIESSRIRNFDSKVWNLCGMDIHYRSVLAATVERMSVISVYTVFIC